MADVFTNTSNEHIRELVDSCDSCVENISEKVPRKIICFLWALVAIRLVCPFAIESRFSLIPDTQGIFADYENQLENAGTDNVNAGLPDISGAVGELWTMKWSPPRQC